MEYEEVNNPNPPKYMPTPQLVKGYTINPDSVIEFLGSFENLEHYKKMVFLMLRFQIEKKRIVICDEPENIIKWIAALHYSLPLDIAKKVNFTTYEFDPELSTSQICGVVSTGSKYNCDSYISSNRHFVFDFLNNQFTDVVADNNFMDFLEIAFSFSYDSLLDFKRFVIDKTSYRECNEKYYSAYYLYTLFFEGIQDITKNQFIEITEFVNEFTTDEVKKELVLKLLDEKYNINQLDTEYALLIVGYMLEVFNILSNSQQNKLKQMIIDRLILLLETDEMTEEAFMQLYDSVNNSAYLAGFSIPAELMIERNRESLIKILSQDSHQWKVDFVVKIISNYVKDMKLSVDELYIDKPTGAIYYAVMNCVHKNRYANLYETIEGILDGFKDSTYYYINMLLSIEEILLNLGLDKDEKEDLWESFYNETLMMDEESIEIINIKLEECNRYAQMHYIFKQQLVRFSTFPETREFFACYWERWFTENIEYAKKYAESSFQIYVKIFEGKCETLSDKEKFNYSYEIFNMAIRLGITDLYVERLGEKILECIPFGKPNADNIAIISEIYKYIVEIVNKKLEGKLLLFYVALQLNKITNTNDILMLTKEIHKVMPETGAKFVGMSERKVKDYFKWAFNTLSDFRLLKEEYEAIYNLFDFSIMEHNVFMKYWCKISYKDSKSEKDYTDFAEYLRFMFQIGEKNDLKMTGKYLCNLSKQRLDELDDEMLEIHFKRDRKSLNAWNVIKNVALRTNPVLNNLSKMGNLFRKK